MPPSTPQKTPRYLPWRFMIPRDIVLSVVLAFGEAVAERVFLPGLHRTPSRAAFVDPARIDDLSTLVAWALGFNLILIWMFFLGLYTIGFFTRRPLQYYATTIVGGALMVLVFVGATAEWFAMPTPPPK